MNEDFDDFGNLRSWQEPPPKGVDLEAPPPQDKWPFPTWDGKPLPKPKRQPRPAPTYPDAPDAPF